MKRIVVRTTFIGCAVYSIPIGSCGNDCRSSLLVLGGDGVKDDIQFKVKLLEQLNSNLDLLLGNYAAGKGERIEELIDRLALIDQCIDQTMLLISLERRDTNFHRRVKQSRH